MTEPAIYVFSGVVLPERAYVHIHDPIRRDFRNVDAGINGTIQISIIKNQISVVLQLNQKYADILTLKNVIVDTIYCLTDSICFEMACALHVDIRSVLDIQSGQSAVFESVIPAMTGDENELQEIRLFPIFDVAGREPLFGRAIGDYRSAIDRPKDTGFYCYRAFESVLHVVCREIDSKKKPKRIDALHHRLGITAACTTKLQDLGGDVRHGKIVWFTDLDRLQALRIAKEIIERAVKYYSSDPDSRPKFPLFELPTS